MRINTMTITMTRMFTKLPNVKGSVAGRLRKASFKPTTTFYSRASPVNCSRWLGILALCPIFNGDSIGFNLRITDL